MAAIELNTERPDPHPPNIRKRDLYIDPSVFQELDEDVFKVEFVVLHLHNAICKETEAFFVNQSCGAPKVCRPGFERGT